MKTAIIVNDTSKVFHYGCQLVIENITKLLEKNDISVVQNILYRDYGVVPKVLKYVEKHTPNYVVINGEGSIHHERILGIELLSLGKKIKTIYPNIKVVLINATIEKMGSYLSLLEYFDLVHVREPYSQKYLAENNFTSKLTPDISLYSENITLSEKTGSGILIGGSVVAKKMHEHMSFAQKNGLDFSDILYFPKGSNKNIFILTKKVFYTFVKIINTTFNTRFLIQDSHKKIQDLRQYENYVSGRFHDIYVSIKSGINFFLISSNSYKIESTLSYIGLTGKNYSRIDEVDIQKLQYTQEEKEKVQTFYKYGVEEIENLFTTITNL